MQQRIHQRPPIARIFRRPRPRMHHHSGRLVHYRQILVLVNNV